MSCNSAYRLRYWNAVSRSVAGAEAGRLQQCLPLAVLKLDLMVEGKFDEDLHVATVLTACGIETLKQKRITIHRIAPSCNSAYRLRYWNQIKYSKQKKNIKVATVLTACGIETIQYYFQARTKYNSLQQCLPLAVLKLNNVLAYDDYVVIVATVLTACGIETRGWLRSTSTQYYWLQQCLPLAVLKLDQATSDQINNNRLQQCLPLAVLKRWIMKQYNYKLCPLQQCLPLAVLKLV